MVTYISFQNKGVAMGKVIAVVVAMVMMASVCFARQVSKELIDETINSTNTSSDWAERYLGDSKKVSFFVTRDATSSTRAVTVDVTAQISVDGTNWTDAKWYDLAGGTTLQVNEHIENDGTYLMWLEPNAPAPYVRIRISADATDKWVNHPNSGFLANDCYITVTLVEEK